MVFVLESQDYKHNNRCESILSHHILTCRLGNASVQQISSHVVYSYHYVTNYATTSNNDHIIMQLEDEHSVVVLSDVKYRQQYGN